MNHTFRYALPSLSLLALVATGCESVEGTATVDGEVLSIVECKKLSASSVELTTDGTEKIRLEDRGTAGDVIATGSGACLSRQMCTGMEMMGCDPNECVEFDLFVYMGCVGEVSINENSTARNGVQLVDVEASVECSQGDRSISVEATIDNCS